MVGMALPLTPCPCQGLLKPNDLNAPFPSCCVSQTTPKVKGAFEHLYAQKASQETACYCWESHRSGTHQHPGPEKRKVRTCPSRDPTPQPLLTSFLSLDLSISFLSSSTRLKDSLLSVL